MMDDDEPVTIWRLWSWTCPACGDDNTEQPGVDEPSPGEELECGACGASALAGEAR